MNDSQDQYRLLRERLDRRYADAVAEAQREHKEGVDALDTLWRSLKAALPGGTGGVQHGDLIAAVRAVTATMTNRYSVHDVKRIIKIQYPLIAAANTDESMRKGVSSAMRKLAGMGVPSKIEVGRGNRPTTYVTYGP